MSKLFVTGTDTGVGKTVTSAWLCRHWRAEYWKPVQCGLENPDTQFVQALCGAHTHPETHRLTAPKSPHQAACQQGSQIKLSDFHLPDSERLVVEGAGGCLVPLNWRETVLDLIQHLGLCTMLVARSGLGTINHTCLSLQALKMAQVPVLGVVLVGPPHPENKEAIEHFGQVPVLAEIPLFHRVDADTLNQHPLPERLLNALGSL